MRYLMKQRFFTLSDQFVIQNEDHVPVYQVKGRLMSVVDQLSFQDMEGNELAFIRQKLMALTPTYQIFRDDKLMAYVHRKMFSLRPKFTVDVPGPNDFMVTGDFLNHEYIFTRSDKEVGRVSKKWFTLTDTYGVEVVDDEDAILILASTVAIDQALHERPSR